MYKRVGIIGGGIMGRLLAWQLCEAGCDVTLIEKKGPFIKGSASDAAGGMLSPFCEQELSDPKLYPLSKRGLELWPQILTQLKQKLLAEPICLHGFGPQPDVPDPFYQQKGSLLVAHREDHGELAHAMNRLQYNLPHTDSSNIALLNKNALRKKEPELKFNTAYFIATEGQIDARAVLFSLYMALEQQPKMLFYFDTPIKKISLDSIYLNSTSNGDGTDSFSFPCVIDCRGAEAHDKLPALRPVRGELIYLHAPNVNLTHPIRLFHPRYRLYIIPRPKHIYLIGATEIEADDASPISVQSTLELLSAAYSVHPGFAEARIIETVTGLRPALKDNLPRIYYSPGHMAINGLYRHGFLLAPALAEAATQLITHNKTDPLYHAIIEEYPYDSYTF